jgi:hypothetical protein
MIERAATRRCRAADPTSRLLPITRPYPCRRADYTYLESFKLSLHEGSGQQLPADLTPVQVVADYLGLLRRCAWLQRQL